MSTAKPSGFAHLPAWLSTLLLLPAGALTALSFAPGPLPAWFLPWLQLAGFGFFFYHLLGLPNYAKTLKAAFIFGFGYFALGLYWVYISLHHYGGLSSLLAAGSVAILAAGMALYFVVFALVTRWLAPCHSGQALRLFDLFYIAIVWASAWTLSEWLRGTLFTGLPWLNTAYAHTDSALAGWAPVLGVYGMGWISAFLATGLALVVRSQHTPNDRPAAIVVLCGVLIAAGGLGLKQLSWSEPAGKPLFVRLVQGNIPQSQKFDPLLMRQGLETYMELASLPPKESGAEPALVVLPETIMTLLQDNYPPSVWEHWRSIAANTGSTLLMGAPIRSNPPQPAQTPASSASPAPHTRVTNSAILFSGNTPLPALLSGEADARYDKHHLVPFGEFIPPGFRWFVDALNIPLGDFDRGTVRQPLFTVADQTIAPNICYEDVFGEEIIASVRDDAQYGPGATLLVNISNLGWFGNTMALRQHLQIARMRAIETARPMLRATNTGVTAAISPSGEVRAQLPTHVTGVLDVEVQGTSGITPYVRWGNQPILIWALLFLLAAAGRRFQTKSRQHHA